MDVTLARTIWHRLETLNAVTYFAPESREASTNVGLKGFWMGYFAFRAAPMGPVPAGVVEATFYNFHPARVRRAIPDAWSFASPLAIVEARARSAAAALRRHLPEGAADTLAAQVIPLLDSVVGRAAADGRPLFAANRDVAAPEDPVARLWQAATTLREHRGDGHVALLVGADLDGCEVHVLLGADEGLDPDLFRQSRGWSEDEWQAAVDRLAARGLLAADGSITPSGRDLRSTIEHQTDELALVPFSALGEGGIDTLLGFLDPAARRVAAAKEISFPNPMGLPPPETSPDTP
jgi:hypothetical protein